MEHKIKAPQVGESITEVRVLKWAKANGSGVKAGDILVEIETDKATVEVAAESSGALKILRQDGELVKVGEVLGSIDDSSVGFSVGSSVGSTAGSSAGTSVASPRVEKNSLPSPRSAPLAPSAAPSFTSGPAARKIAEEKGISLSNLSGSGKDSRVTKGDLLGLPVSSPTPSTPVATQIPDKAGDRRVPMTRIRMKIAERLVQAQHTAAILTTFNEVDMSGVMDLRKKHKDSFKEKNGVSLSFMSFFTRASVLSLKNQSLVNAAIDGTDVIYHDYIDIGIAVGTDRGLVVPVLRGADKMSFVDIEKNIGALALKARDSKLSIADMSGGTFTISNGGTYGSLLSTPILNMPQSAILGMHKIQDRPIAVEGKVVIRPMMYLALSYDHRLIDGKEAVSFLVHLKELLEKPESLGLDWIAT